MFLISVHLLVLVIFDNKGNCEKLFYEHLIRETEGEFLIEEYEVFQIIKN